MADDFTITQEITDQIKTFDNPTVDGFVKNNGDNYINTDTLVTGFTTSTRSFIEWDISGIDDNSTINIVKLIYHGNWNSIDCHIHECLGQQPSTFSDGAGASALYTELGEGWIYADVADFPVVGTNQIIILGATSSASACSELQSQLTNDWYAIGIQSDDEAQVENFSIIYSEEYGAVTPAPSLYVEYDINSTCTLSQPNTITRGHIRKTESHLFPDGTFKRHDIGSSGKEIIMSGSETSAAVTNFNIIDIMMGEGEHITLAGMDNTDLNTDWYITDFTWKQNEGYVDRYDWNLVLKEV